MCYYHLVAFPGPRYRSNRKCTETVYWNFNELIHKFYWMISLFLKMTNFITLINSVRVALLVQSIPLHFYRIQHHIHTQQRSQQEKMNNASQNQFWTRATTKEIQILHIIISRLVIANIYDKIRKYRLRMPVLNVTVDGMPNNNSMNPYTWLRDGILQIECIERGEQSFDYREEIGTFNLNGTVVNDDDAFLNHILYTAWEGWTR